MSLVNTINLSFEMTKALTDMEVNGIKINVDTASGGPFINKKFKSLRNVSFKEKVRCNG